MDFQSSSGISDLISCWTVEIFTPVSQSTRATSRLTKQGYQINIYFELKNIEMDFLETFYIDMLKLVVICLHFRNEDICHLMFVYIF